MLSYTLNVLFLFCDNNPFLKENESRMIHFFQMATNLLLELLLVLSQAWPSHWLQSIYQGVAGEQHVQFPEPCVLAPVSQHSPLEGPPLPNPCYEDPGAHQEAHRDVQDRAVLPQQVHGCQAVHRSISVLHSKTGECIIE